MERAVIGGIRFKLDLYINLRPIKLYSESLCPIAAIMATQMMLEFLGEKKAAVAIEDAVGSLLRSGRIKSPDAKSGISTSEMGDMVVEELKA